MNTSELYSIKAPSEAETAEYLARAKEIGWYEAAVERVREHAHRLMSGADVAVVEVPRVVDLETYRDRRRT